MAIQDFIYKIGADVTQFTKSISEVEAKLTELRKSLKNQTGQAIIDTNKQIVSLEKSLVNLKQVGLDKIGGSTKNAGYALNSLSQVARDLPFGFIAIQNNLPLVVDAFGQLTTESKGTIPALKSLGQSLIGPAGIGLAFSAITSIVTYAIQKYGSFGNAIEALFSKNSELAASQNLYNKELSKSIGDTQTEIEKINILSNTLNNSKKPQADRYAAYVELRKISPDIVAGIKEENALTQRSIDIINKNIEARKGYLLLRAKESAITAVINKNASEQFSLEQERPKLLAKEKALQDQVNLSKKTGYDSQRTFNGVVSTTEINLASASAAVIENKKQIDNLTEVNKKYVEQLVPTILGISQYDASIQTLNNSLKKETKELTGAEIAAAALLKIYKDLAVITRGQAIQLDTKSLQKIQSKGIDLTPKIDIKKAIDVNKISGIQAVTTQLAINLQKATEDANKYIVNNFNKTFDAIANGFFNPIQDLFSNFIQTGKFAFQEFGKAVLQAISQIVAKVIATGIITLLASIFTGGLGAGGAVAKSGGFGKILLGALGIGGIANPQFGGIQPGGMQMAGSVSLVLRGQDLVGSLNRTNSQFSRVG